LERQLLGKALGKVLGKVLGAGQVCIDSKMRHSNGSTQSERLISIILKTGSNGFKIPFSPQFCAGKRNVNRQSQKFKTSRRPSQITHNTPHNEQTVDNEQKKRSRLIVYYSC
jgi:hypothetical protein